MTQKDCLMVLSGGMDSVTMLHEFHERIALAVTFDYGCNHGAREMKMAHLHCQRLGIPHKVISLPFIHEMFHSSLLEGADAIPEGHYADENMRSTVVPFRNGIMLAVCAGLAEDSGLAHVMLANHAGDHSIYPDCRPEFVEAMSKAVQSGTYTKTDVWAPYTLLTKADIARRGAAMGIDYAETWSCYKGGDVHCGRCGTCVERREALAEAGVKDTTVYEE